MGPALQRLLSRPQSLDLLRSLVGTPTREKARKFTLRRRQSHNDRYYSSSLTAVAASTDLDGLCDVQDSLISESFHEPRPQSKINNKQLGGRSEHISNHPIHYTNADQYVVTDNPTWNGRSLTFLTIEDIRFEADVPKLAGASTHQRLVDRAEFALDYKLWAYLLNYQKTNNGDAGVLKLWEAMQSRDLRLPTTGQLAQRLWSPLLDTGIRHPKLLLQICEYADKLYQESQRRWPELYTHVMRRIMLHGTQDEAIRWHFQLVRGGHKSNPEFFRIFMRTMILSQRHAEVLKTIYRLHSYRNTYSKIMTRLLGQDDFSVALDWHVFLTRHGDFPESGLSRYVNILFDHILQSTRDLEKAIKQSSFIIATCSPRPRTAREVMSLAQGEAFHIVPKEYNDRLGARWFATKWVSLDFAMNAINAFGFDSIGPLSIQAIALREREAAGVLLRIHQLRDLGISIGKSVFSRAVLSFAQNEEQEYLTGLIESDQHPDSFEDDVLQEKLLSDYAKVGDWKQYRLTAAIRLATARRPDILSHDFALKRHALNGNRVALLNLLQKMHREDIPVGQATTEYVVGCVLGRRRNTSRIANTPQNWTDLQIAINILTEILKANGQVSPYSWREIMRRLGMIGRLDELERLCLWLASWHSEFKTHTSITSDPFRKAEPYPSGSTTPKSSSQTDLEILFPSALQSAIVEWGFIHATSPNTVSLYPVATRHKDAQVEQYVRGIQIVRKLKEKGVVIRQSAVKAGLKNRLVVLYGSGQSLVPRNRLLKAQNITPFQELLNRARMEWGERLWDRTTTLTESIMKKSVNNVKMARDRKSVSHEAHKAIAPKQLGAHSSKSIVLGSHSI